MVWGNKHELAREMELLDNIDKTIAGIYAKRGDQPAEVYAELMEAETWMNAESALGWGLVDEITEALPKVARASYAAQLMDGVPAAAVAALANQATPPEGDTEGVMEQEPETDGDGQGQEPQDETAQERSFAVLDGRIYEIAND